MENQGLLDEMAKIFNKPFSDEAIEAFETALAEMEKNDPEYKGAVEAYTNALIEINKAPKESHGIIITTLIHKCLNTDDVIQIIEEERKFMTAYMITKISESDTSLGRLTKGALKHQDNNE